MKRGQNIKYQPYVFTEHGAVMLANVLRSTVCGPREHPGRARVRAPASAARANQDLARKIDTLERKVDKHDADLQTILSVLHKLLQPPPPPKRPIGFAAPKEN